MKKNLWLDEGGAILSVELILIMVMVVIGLVVGLKALRDAVDAKLAEVAAAVAAIDPGYGFGGITYLADATTSGIPDGAWVAGSGYLSQMAPVAAIGAFDAAAVLDSEDLSAGGVLPAIVSP